MRTTRRAWTPPIPLTMVMALAVAAPLGLTGCKQIKELTGDKDKESDESDDPAPTPEADTQKPDEPPPEAKAELAEAKDAGLAEAAIAPPPPVAVELTKLEDLLTLVPASDKGVVVVRDASVFMTYIESSTRFATGPMAKLAVASANNPEFAGMAGEALAMKGQFDATKATIEASGVHLDKGMIIGETSDGRGLIVYSGDQPDALPTLIKSFDPTTDMVCKSIEGHAAGYIACTESQEDLDAYQPGGEAGAAALRARWATSMPGVDFEAANVILDMPSEDLHVTIETPPGVMIVSMVAPKGDAEFDEMVASLAPSPGKLLRAVQPGAGFLWGNVSPQVIAAMLPEIQNNDAPQPVKDLASQFNGEFLLAGHYRPAAVALQFGLNDDAAWAGVAAELEKVMPEVKRGIVEEMDVPGGTWSVGMVDIPVGSEQVKAVHAGLTGVPEADVLAQMTGLTIDGWAFVANDAMHFALGASPEAIGHLAASEAEIDGPSPGLQAYLPAPLSAALAANQVSFISHFPLDALHSPQARELMSTAFKNVEEVKPEYVLAFFDLASPLSSGTVWMTHTGGRVQLHLAVQTIGHQANDEGKAALAAAIAVTGGADPASSYGALVAQYPDSSRLAAYKMRAGHTQAGLVASGIGAMVATGALAYPVFTKERNEEIAKELHIEEGAAEKAKEESKTPPKPKPAPKPAPKPTPDPKPAPDPGPAPTPDPPNPGPAPDPSPGPAPDPSPGPAPDPSPGPAPDPSPTPPPPNPDDAHNPDGDRPKPPPIIPARKK